MPNESYLDLDAAVRAWARKEFDDVASKKQKKLRQKERAKKQAYMHLTIDWSDVNINDTTKDFDIVDATKAKKTSAAETANHVDEASVTKSGLKDADKPSMSVLFKTKFQNRTKHEQEYTMRTEKTTRATFFTETENGYTKGFDMSITLKTPCEVLEASAGYHREYSLTEVNGQEFEEEMTWGVDSVIKVEANHIAEAELVVHEDKKAGNFTIQSEISGRVFVTFTNIKDNNSFVMAVSEDICAVIADFVRVERRKPNNAMEYVEIDEQAGLVRVTTKGKCGFQYGIRQEVLVEQSPVDPADAAK